MTDMERNLHHYSGERNIKHSIMAEAAQKAALRLGYPSLREHQLEAVISFVSGFCRAAAYALLLVFDQLEASSGREPSIIVVATALMKDQVSASP